mmetsp:Transcript_11699/g.18114  ORF Transcript_11699/g.18114 Transcript_11699/m.18114 type:complete len:1064 (-) Transcript_11699:93-3284(-)|eukprot:CAMPEP_0195281436 /NCGR_PEP_ID=MMETSP0707-20130614/745_1 /TAXON_ID=33640 /ORGANISM="Asterionellopsis glacialis, Strain CCMP134" /LENGTH=1063 /DNA_ID=CAMNT_0040340319 /DNA_START=149 /DNA_END=3340 /DNA_ORIENTATION=-
MSSTASATSSKPSWKSRFSGSRRGSKSRLTASGDQSIGSSQNNDPHSVYSEELSASQSRASLSASRKGRRGMRGRLRKMLGDESSTTTEDPLKLNQVKSSGTHYTAATAPAVLPASATGTKATKATTSNLPSPGSNNSNKVKKASLSSSTSGDTSPTNPQSPATGSRSSSGGNKNRKSILKMEASGPTNTNAAIAAAAPDNTMTKEEYEAVLAKQARKERDGFCRRVNQYDGQVIEVDEKPTYELGNYLGGGVAGVVYEGHRLRPKEDYPVRNGIMEGDVPRNMWNQPGTIQPAQHSPMALTAPIFCSTSTAGSCLGPTMTTQPVPSAPKSTTSTSGAATVVSTASTSEERKSSAQGDTDMAIEATDEVQGSVVLDVIDAPSRSAHAARAASMSENDTGVDNNGAVGAIAMKGVPNFGLLDETVAIKILNPVGFRLLTADAVGSAIVVREGIEMEDNVKDGTHPLTYKHVWWLINPNSRNLRTLQRYSGSQSMPLEGNSNTNNQKSSKRVDVDRGSPEKGLRLSLVAAFKDPKTGALKELPLTKCIEIWGHVPFSATDKQFEEMMEAIERVNSGQAPPPGEEDQDEMTGVSTATDAKEGMQPCAPSRVGTEVSEGEGDNTTTGGDASTAPVDLKSGTRARTGLYRAAASTRQNLYCQSLNAYIAVPAVPPKYLRWLRQRRAATKEIRNMMLIGRHRNVVHLYEVLELIQDSKSTMFLILELVRGGELFDLISSNSTAPTKIEPSEIPDGWSEAEVCMRKFFLELASGIHYCHSNGIAHRDLKPENLLVHTGPTEEATLKIADFGLSATFGITRMQNELDMQSPPASPKNSGSFGAFETSQHSLSDAGGGMTGNCDASPITDSVNNISAFGVSALSFLTCGAVEDVFCPNNEEDTDQQPSPLRRMTSVVGSPHYVAPEIISQNDDDKHKSRRKSSGGGPGYDGTKADVWSAGVILYAMLFRSLPFGEDLLRCPRYQSFAKWYAEARRFGSRRSTAAAALNPIFSEADEEMMGPHWFFPSAASAQSRDLIVAMLNPDPEERLSIEMVLQHSWTARDPSTYNKAMS